MVARLQYVLAIALALLVVSETVAVVPARANVSAYGMGALKAEWLAGYNGGPGIDVNGLFDLDLMRDANVKLYRARFRQDQVLSNGTYSQWTMLDNLAKQSALRDVTLQPVLINMPSEQYTPPLTDAARASFADFAAAAARRYGPGGTFWPGCECPEHPVSVWEVWNEANVSGFWNPPSPHDYALLLQAVKSKLREADPEARIMFGGLAYPSSPNGTTSLEPNGFLQSVIATVGPDGFDALALHSYHASASAGVSAIGATVATLETYAGTDASGAPRQQVWVNEFGKPTTPDNPATTTVNEQQTSEAVQQDWLNAFLDGLLPNRSAWNLGPVFWYSLRDAANPTAAWQRLGLRRTKTDDSDAGPKPAWTAYTARSNSSVSLPLPTPLVATPSAPVVATGAATSVGATSATLNGTVNAENQPTTYHFVYWTTTGYGSTTPDQTVSPIDYASHAVAANVSGLTPGATYHYRLVATNATGTTQGEDRVFTSALRSYRDTVLGTTGLASYWRLGEQNGTTTAADETGISPGRYLGGYTLGGPSALAGDSNTSVGFDGVSGEMTTPGPALAASGSIEGWFNWQSGVALMRDGTSTGSTGWILAYDRSGYLYYRVGGTSFNTGRATASIRNGWHHFVATKDGSNVAFYIDGQLVRRSTAAASTAPTMPWHIMRNGGYAQFTRGSADEVAAYNVALSPATVQEHYNAGRR
jgi:Concanavalin A-like lectin/glucanases superfamily